MLSVDATPIRFEPSNVVMLPLFACDATVKFAPLPRKLDAVTIPVVNILS